MKKVEKRLEKSCFVLLCGALLLPGTAATDDEDGIELRPIGTYESGVFAEGAAEIVAHDPRTQRLFVVNANAATVDVLDIHDPTRPVKLKDKTIEVINDIPESGGVNSVAVKNGIVAVAVQNADKQKPGWAAFYDTDGNFLKAVPAGALPDMITFTRDGNWVLVANEGEPSDDYTVDPEGSVSVIDISRGIAAATVRTAGFEKFDPGMLDPSIRIYGPGASVAQDLEPEFITTSDDSETAWVVFQENNAIGILDIEKAEFTELVGLGTKNHSTPEKNALDASNEDGAINITNWPVHGMFQPDAITSYRYKGATYLVTANEGDSRDYPGFSEEERVKDVVLDPVAFPNAADLQKDENLGRLKTTTVNGDTDGDGDYDCLFSYGARSFSIWTASGHQVFDSGDDFEQITAVALPDDFNSDDEENGSFDERSDDKGPEPEGVTVGKVSGNTYAFIGLERIGGIMVYDVSNPFHVSFVQYINTRDFDGNPEAGTAGDLSPEGLAFIKARKSPNGKPLLVVGYEVSGTTTIFQIDEVDD